jgi:hypothetical protein
MSPLIVLLLAYVGIAIATSLVWPSLALTLLDMGKTSKNPPSHEQAEMMLKTRHDPFICIAMGSIWPLFFYVLISRAIRR